MKLKKLNNCIKKCGRLAGATPWLCMSCLTGIAKQIVIFESSTINTNDENFGIKRIINKIQKKSRKAYKKYQ